MQAGKLRHRVELQRATVTADSHGDQVKAWTTLRTVWASIEPLSGREYLQGAQTSSDITARIKIRGGVTLTPKDRVKYGDRVFDIRHVIDWGGRGIETQLMCVERFN